ncbi:DUF421 domain-containing protein [Angustibacter sp. McL0619]|uniref:DUF421 domain-containing protein n=1 Tax=Angustibacter sp. McL0619 TaxID=3415676 RepID=UPI003CEA7CEF
MEIVFRAAVVFAFLWMITRATGKSTLGELSTFQLLLYVVMGDLIQQGVTQQDYSLTGAVLAVSVFALLTVALSWVSFRWPVTRPVVHGAPLVVVRDGTLLQPAMASERLSTDDLYEAAREQGIRRIGDVELAVLEADGRISFFRRQNSQDLRPVDSQPLE